MAPAKYLHSKREESHAQGRVTLGQVCVCVCIWMCVSGEGYGGIIFRPWWKLVGNLYLVMQLGHQIRT